MEMPWSRSIRTSTTSEKPSSHQCPDSRLGARIRLKGSSGLPLESVNVTQPALSQFRLDHLAPRRRSTVGAAREASDVERGNPVPR
jgi:hypothetical protein